ncbi:MAG: IMPACT family protein [Promethearchaeota archaeon]
MIIGKGSFIKKKKQNTNLNSTVLFQIAEAGQSFPILEKKSKFISSASPVSNEAEAKVFIQKIKDQHHRANHNCWAYRIFDPKGIISNESDEGEPSGTAGQPILYVLEKQNIVNTVIVVTRYFGGIKLGKGGLVRAYSKSCSQIVKFIGLKKISNSTNI